MQVKKRQVRQRGIVIVILLLCLIICHALSFAGVPAPAVIQATQQAVQAQEKGSAPTPPSIPAKASPPPEATREILHPTQPALFQKDEYPEFTRELLRVEWRAGDPIDLYVIRPHGVEKPPAVLYLYSYPSETDRFRDDSYCQRITYGGYAAIGFVSALTGQRYHSRPMKEWFVSEIVEAMSTTVSDVQKTLDYLAKRGDFDMDRIGMFGAGSGGSIAVLAAAADSRIKAIDLLDPWGHWPVWMAKSSLIPENERPRYVTPEFLKKAAPYDPVNSFGKVGSRPVRIQDVMDDDITPVECSKKIEAAAGTSAEIVHFDDNSSLFRASSGGKLFQWIKDELMPKPGKPNAAD